MGIENLKANLLQDVEKQVIEILDTWEEGNIIQLKDEAAKVNYFICDYWNGDLDHYTLGSPQQLTSMGRV